MKSDIFSFLKQALGYEVFHRNLQFVAWFYPRMQALLQLQTKDEIVRALKRMKQEGQRPFEPDFSSCEHDGP